MIQGVIMEHIRALWCLELSITIQIYVVWLALKDSIIIELAHNVDFMCFSLSV